MTFSRKQFSRQTYNASAHIRPKTYLAKLLCWTNGFWQKYVEKHRYLFICMQCISLINMQCSGHFRQKHCVGHIVFNQKIWNCRYFSVFSYTASANIQPETYLANIWYWSNGFWQKDVEKHRYLFICMQCISHIKQKHGVGQKVFWPKDMKRHRFLSIFLCCISQHSTQSIFG